MKPTKAYIVLFALLICSSLVHAQYGAQQRGDYYFSKFAYAKAIPEYELMLNGGVNTNYAHQQLAECYLLLRDFKKSIPHFEAIIHGEGVPKDYYFKYAMALYSDGQMEASEEWLKKYKKYNKNDSRVNRFLKEGNLASIVFNSQERYQLDIVTFNSEHSDFGAYLHQGKLYFASGRTNHLTKGNYGWNNEPWLDIFWVYDDVPFYEPEPLEGNVNTKFHESSPVYSTDYANDTIIYFTRNNYFDKKAAYGAENEINLKIYSAKRKDGKWMEDRSLPINSDYYSTGHPTVNKERTRIYYTSDMPGGYGGTDIYYSEIHERGGIGKPVNLGPVINTEGNEMFPFINEEGQLFFSSEGHVGFGQLDVFSTITDEEGEFVDVINLGTPVNSPADDFAYYGFPNGIDGYVSSNREGGQGSDDIYRFRFSPALEVEGYVTDGINLKPLDSVQLTLFDQRTNTIIAQTFSDEKGYYKFPVQRKTPYMIEAVRKTHPHKNVFFDTSRASFSQKTLRQDIVLDPVMDLKLLAGLKKIYFDFDMSNIRPDAAVELDKVIHVMNDLYPDMIIALESHTDPMGTHEYNDDLSERRAYSTYKYLIDNGIEKSRIVSYKGFGKRRPVNDCTSFADCSPEDLELNRRTEFPILQIKKGKALAK
jgi:outer membrane protein OmpA-like peptidoglycan-associated protein/tetratricopeptide (TPR) repeat protein